MTKSIVLITGAHGMVGKNLGEHPSSKGYTLLTPAHKELDLLDHASVLTFMRKYQPSLVIHAAGKVGGIQANMANPVNFLVQNWDMGRNVLMSAHSCGVKHLINLGSSCMYPRHAENPLKETTILQGELEPTNEGYALAKISVARLAEYINRENQGFTYKTLTPCNLYGRWDKFGPENSHLLPAIIRKIDEAIEAKAKTVEIWGDGLARREFMYAQDVADAIWFFANKLDLIPQNMNIGLGQDHSINDYYQAVADVLGYKGTFTHDLTRPVGMKQKLVDISLSQTFGWEPRYSLEQGIKLTAEFYQKEIKK